jgi:hypothetical protein
MVTAVGGEAMEMIDAIELAELRRKARCWDAMLHAKKTTQAEPDDTGWKRAAREHGLMEAARQCRTAHGFSLLEAKECVTAYLQNRR